MIIITIIIMIIIIITATTTTTTIIITIIISWNLNMPPQIPKINREQRVIFTGTFFLFCRT